MPSGQKMHVLCPQSAHQETGNGSGVWESNLSARQAEIAIWVLKFSRR